MENPVCDESIKWQAVKFLMFKLFFLFFIEWQAVKFLENEK
jgi:hypothetical protein